MIPRRITNSELAYLSEDWENPTVDTTQYYQCALKAWEVTEGDYLIWKSEGGLCQKVNRGDSTFRYYIA